MATIAKNILDRKPIVHFCLLGAPLAPRARPAGSPMNAGKFSASKSEALAPYLSFK
jgi:hypothetical protein